MTLPIEFLHWAGMSDEFLYKLQDFVKKQPELLHSVNSYNDNALIIAARTGNKDIVKYLLGTQIDINHTVVEGNALMIALEKADKTHKEISKMLIKDERIDVFCVNEQNQNAFFCAAKSGNDEAIEYLFEKGLNINHLDNQGNNIMFSFLNGYTSHENYWCFELILSLIKEDVLFLRNKKGVDIFDFMTSLSQEALDNHNQIRYQRLQQNFAPLRHVLLSIQQSISE